MRIPLRTSLLLLLLSLSPARAEEASPVSLTLDQAVGLGLKRNIEVELAERDLEIFQYRYRAVFGAAVPDVTVSGDYTRNFRRPVAFFGGRKTEVGEKNSMSAGVDVEQTIFSGGRLGAGLKAARLGVGAAEDALRGNRDEVVLTVKRLFYAVLLASATADIQRDNLASTENHLSTIRKRYRQGLDSDVTALRQEVEVANAKPALISARNFYEISLISLQDALKLDLDRPVEVQGELEAPSGDIPSYDALVRTALARRPEIQAAHRRAKAAAALAEVSRGDLMPQLSIFGNYRWVAQSPDLTPGTEERATSAAGGLRLSYPIFTGGENWGRFQAAKAEATRAGLAAEKIERGAQVDVKRQWLAVQESLERVMSQTTAIQQARRVLESTEVRYRAGQASQLELNDATLALNRARLLDAQALHDYWVSRAALERAVGADLKEVQP